MSFSILFNIVIYSVFFLFQCGSVITHTWNVQTSCFDSCTINVGKMSYSSCYTHLHAIHPDTF